MRLSFLAVAASLIALPVLFAADPLTPAEAAKKSGEEVTVKMEVKSSSLRDGLCYLNSETDFKDAKNFTIFLDRETVKKFKTAKIDDPATHFKGKTIEVKGKVELRKEKPQIKISGPDAIKVVNEK